MPLQEIHRQHEREAATVTSHHSTALGLGLPTNQGFVPSQQSPKPQAYHNAAAAPAWTHTQLAWTDRQTPTDCPVYVRNQGSTSTHKHNRHHQDSNTSYTSIKPQTTAAALCAGFCHPVLSAGATAG
jgi:hypothetical protein